MQKFCQLFFLYTLISASFGLVYSAVGQKTPKKVVKTFKNVKVKKIRKKIILAPSKIANAQLCGSVFILAGNHMPGPDQPINNGEAVIREILIYPLTKISDTQGDGTTSFTKINLPLVKKIISDKYGKFCTSLPVGKYSLFINDPGYGLFANIFDGEMNICPVEILKGEKKDILLQITHSAVF